MRIASALVIIGLLFLLVAPRLEAQDAWPTSQSYANAASDNGNWILPARSYSGNRYVPSPQSSSAAVATLQKAWSTPVDARGPLEVSPIVWHGTMYVTSSHNDV